MEAKKLGKELRKSHFHFQQEVKDPFLSMGRSMLQDYSSGMEYIDSRVRGIKLTKTNYKLGTDDTNYRSEATNSFVRPGKQKVAKLNEEKLNDLRKHHFHLGYAGDGKQSTVTQYSFGYGPKKQEKIDPEEVRARKEYLTRHNFKLGNNSKPSYKTGYLTDFHKEGAPTTGAALTKAELQAQVLALRATNISLGCARNKRSQAIRNMRGKTGGTMMSYSKD